MEPDRDRDWDDETREAVEAFSAAIAGAASGAGGERLRAALAAERRREDGNGRIGLLLRIAAVLLLGIGACLFLPRSLSPGGVVVCPHGTSDIEKDETLPETLRAFLKNPDNFRRVCQCRPLYSGSQRHDLTSPYAR